MFSVVGFVEIEQKKEEEQEEIYWRIYRWLFDWQAWIDSSVFSLIELIFVRNVVDLIDIEFLINMAVNILARLRQTTEQLRDVQSILENQGQTSNGKFLNRSVCF